MAIDDFFSAFNSSDKQVIKVPKKVKKRREVDIPDIELPEMKHETIDYSPGSAGLTRDTGYDFNLENWEQFVPPAKDTRNEGVYGFIKNKGKQAYNMIQPSLINLVKKFEGYSDTAYLPTKNDVPTVGYGTTKGVKLGDKITPEKAEELLHNDLKEAQGIVDKLVTVPLNENQRNALTSLVYNVGETEFRNSKALAALNAGDFDTFQKEAYDPKHGFVHQDGVVLTGLVNRRQHEKELFNA